MTRKANSLYLGWGNPRQAIAVRDAPVVTLVDGEEWTVLQGPPAIAFKQAISQVTNHICGIKWNDDCAAMIRDIEGLDGHHVKLFNKIFDQYW